MRVANSDEPWSNLPRTVSRASSLTLVRHAESWKTVMRRNGGAGFPLTDQGVREAHLSALEISRLVGHGEGSFTVFTSTTRQVLETAQILKAELAADLVTDERLRGTSLGALDGMSDDEIVAYFPEAATRLFAWRRGLLNYTSLELPGAEDQHKFVSRVSEGLIHALSQSGPVVVVATRSSGIAIRNLLDGRALEDFRRVRLAPGSLSVWRRGLGWSPFNWTQHLGSRDSPDD